MRDTPRLLRAVPELRQSHDQVQKLRGELGSHYAEYVATVSDPVMAVSLELACFLAVGCELLAPRTILDLGSGYSSFVFRRYAALASPTPEIVSVDDDVGWLERTHDYLIKKGMPTGKLTTWDAFVASGPGRFDLILHDLGTMETRRRTLRQVLGFADAQGVVVLDDVDKPGYGTYARRLVKAAGLRGYSLKSYTLDWLGRYSMLAMEDSRF